MLHSLIILDENNQKRGLEAKVVNIVHDEFVIEAPESEAQVVKEILKQSMIDGMLAVFPDATFTGLVEAKVCSSWGEGK